MRNSNTFKVITSFVLGATAASDFAIANQPWNPIFMASVDNKSKALFISNNGSCPKRGVLLILEPLELMLKVFHN